MQRCAGENTLSTKGLLGDDHSTLWFEAVEALPPIAQSTSHVMPSKHDLDIVEAKTKVAERLMTTEASAFERRMSKANPADAQWLQTVCTTANAQLCNIKHLA